MSGQLTRLRSQKHAREWAVATVVGRAACGIPDAPTNTVDDEAFITAEDTMKVRR